VTLVGVEVGSQLFHPQTTVEVLVLHLFITKVVQDATVKDMYGPYQMIFGYRGLQEPPNLV